jgi:hypothetical protein
MAGDTSYVIMAQLQSNYLLNTFYYSPESIKAPAPASAPAPAPAAAASIDIYTIKPILSFSLIVLLQKSH